MRNCASLPLSNRVWPSAVIGEHRGKGDSSDYQPQLCLFSGKKKNKNNSKELRRIDAYSVLPFYAWLISAEVAESIYLEWALIPAVKVWLQLGPFASHVLLQTTVGHRSQNRLHSTAAGEWKFTVFFAELPWGVSLDCVKCHCYRDAAVLHYLPTLVLISLKSRAVKKGLLIIRETSKALAVDLWSPGNQKDSLICCYSETVDGPA